MFGKVGKDNVVFHGFLKLRRGRRRRFRCRACGRTFVSSLGTPYHRLKCSRAHFDKVAALSVEGLSKSAIARVMHLSWNTVARWLQRAAEAAERFSARLGRGCIHGRVVKTCRKNRVTKVERDLSIGSEWQLEEALSSSEDSDRLNTAFVERLNLTIRQGSAYLQRRSPAHARLGQCLAGQLELLRCY